MLEKITVWLIATHAVHSMSNLPNSTHVKLGLVVYDSWIKSEKSSAGEVEEIIRSTFAADGPKFDYGEFSLEFTTEVPEDTTYSEGKHYILAISLPIIYY